ncbi:sensor histidine kinase [Halobaculum sp. WSA2]|uniref:histidine kinase n=1 Tax=Halobaculum saliterrae TaxID=2073113 RepID=A0A6B0SZV9_9EURY|nr:HAMP domain-containing sensor histidine kinase [Halobaculum saliterrae]MXR41510.1 sensor histidine kinase [Halobaculum saliterrae]
MGTGFDSSEYWLLVVSGMGVCLGLVLLGETIAIAVGPRSFSLEFAIGFLTSLLAIGALVYARRWIRRSGLSGERYRRIAGWCGGSAVGFLVLNLLFMISIPPESLSLAVAWARWTFSFGGGVGLLIGISQAQAFERARVAERLAAEQQATERQNELLEQFASIVSHDLRNPLNVATGHLDLARETGEDDHLERVESALERMDAIIEETLLLAREGQAVGETTRTDLGAIVETCWATVETADAEIVTEPLPTVEADGNRLRHVFENLFRNAIEHGGEAVTVRVGPLADGSGFFVEDDGPGIPQSEADEVFELGHTTSNQSSGFGLAIVARIVRAHGWEIRVTDSDTGGARFEVTGVTVVEGPASGSEDPAESPETLVGS